LTRASSANVAISCSKSTLFVASTNAATSGGSEIGASGDEGELGMLIHDRHVKYFSATCLS
jgi:hypothetical protein